MTQAREPAFDSIGRGPLPVLVRCDRRFAGRVRYTFDTLLAASGIPVQYIESPPEAGAGPWLLYAASNDKALPAGRHLFVAHEPHAWRLFDEAGSAPKDAATVLAQALGDARQQTVASGDIGFDLAASAFHFLSSWAERRAATATRASRQDYDTSEAVRLSVPQDIVDRHLSRLRRALEELFARSGVPFWPLPEWPGAASFALVLSHDVDYVPVRRWDNAVQGAKAVLRHLIRQRDAGDAWRAACGYFRAIAAGRDPFGCVPEIIAREKALGVRSSFQIAVGHRHPNDVNYRIEDDHVRDYLRAITEAGFDLCLHGSYRSTEDPQWYVQEAELLTRRLARPLGSRQHFLSFDYDRLFTAQEQAGIRYDMSMGFHDRPGPRAGFSYPYFPYNLREDRPYRVLQISLFLMDVTLRSYMGLRPGPARAVIDACLADLRDKRGCASAVWHPIVFGGARDPGYDTLYYDMAERVGAMGGLATDGRTIDAWWRSRARRYPSFDFA